MVILIRKISFSTNQSRFRHNWAKCGGYKYHIRNQDYRISLKTLQLFLFEKLHFLTNQSRFRHNWVKFEGYKHHTQIQGYRFSLKTRY